MQSPFNPFPNYTKLVFSSSKLSLTDVNGEYLFTNLPLDDNGGDNDADYVVNITDRLNVISGLSSTHLVHGNATDAGGNDLDAKNPAGYTVTLTSGNTDSVEADFGYDGTVGSIGDLVFFDTNQNGLYDTGDSPLANVEVMAFLDVNQDGLLDSGDLPVGNVLTDINGQYQFVNQPYGNYILSITDSYLGDMSSTHNASATNNNDGKDPAGYAVGISDTNPQEINADFSYFGDTGSIGNQVYFDANKNGIYDNGDAPIANVEISVYRDLNENNLLDTSDAIVKKVLTDMNGQYVVQHLPFGKYMVTVTDIQNYVNTFTSSHSVSSTVANDDGQKPAGYAVELSDTNPQEMTADFGYFGPTGSIGNHIWYDENQDGVYNNNDAALANVEVSLYRDTDGDGVGDTLLATTLTDVSGEYLFTNLPLDDNGGDNDADYVVNITDRLNVVSGLSSTHIAHGNPYDSLGNNMDAKNPLGYAVTLSPFTPDSLLSDFGYNGVVGSLGDVIYFDTNQNGIYDDGDTPIANVEVSVYLDTNGDGTLNSGDLLSGTGITALDGIYTIENIPFGKYIVTVTDSQNYVNTFTSTHSASGTVANDNGQNPLGYAIELSDINPQEMTADFGYFGLTGTIGNQIWYDENQDGVYNNNDTAMANIEVSLYRDTDGDGSGDTLLATTLTDINGEYLFTNLPLDDNEGDNDADYVVNITDQFNVVSGLSSTHLTHGNPYDSLGNDMDAKNPLGYNVTLSPLNPNSLFSDFGYEGEVGRIGDTIYFDTNQNGIYDDGDTPIANVEVSIFLDINENGTFDNEDLLSSRGITNINGIYMIENLPFGKYLVVVSDSKNYIKTFLSTHSVSNTNDNNDDGKQVDGYFVELNQMFPQNLTADFGYYGAAGSVGNQIFFDTNKNGIYDPANGDTPLAQISVELYRDTDQDGIGDELIASTFSDNEGLYRFSNLALDDHGENHNAHYVILVSDEHQLLTSFTSTHTLHGNPAQSSGNDAEAKDPNGYAVILDATKDTVLTADFGFTGPVGHIGDMVYLDETVDGIFSGNDQPVAGVELTLYRDDNQNQQVDGDDLLISTTVTDLQGIYRFANLPYGNYMVAVTNRGSAIPSHYTTMHEKSNTTDQQDSQNPLGYAITLTAEHPENLTADFGFGPTMEEAIRKGTYPGYVLGGGGGAAIYAPARNQGLEDTEKTVQDYLIPIAPIEPEIQVPEVQPTQAETQAFEDSFHESAEKIKQTLPYKPPQIPDGEAFIRLKDDLERLKYLPLTGYISEKLAQTYRAENLFADLDMNDPYYRSAADLYLQGLLVPGENITIKTQAEQFEGDTINQLIIQPDKKMSAPEAARLMLLASQSGVVRNFDQNFETSLEYPEDWWKAYDYYADLNGYEVGFESSLPGPKTLTFGRFLKMMALGFGLQGTPNPSSVESEEAAYRILFQNSHLIPVSLYEKPLHDPVTRKEVYEILYRILKMKDGNFPFYIEQMQLRVPSLDLSVPANRTLLSRAELWLDDLSDGVGFYQDVRTGNEKDFIIFGHSSKYPWDDNEFGTVFASLVKSLKVGDRIEIDLNQSQTYIYEVTEKRLVTETEVEQFKQITSPDNLTIFTCDWNVKNRWLFSAKRVGIRAFSDVPETHEFAEAINYAYEKGIVKGYDDGTFQPQKEINRAEFTKVIINALYDEESITKCNNVAFNDVGQNTWMSPYICLAQKEGIVSGYDDQTFRPGQPINFAETAKILAKAFGYQQNPDPEIWYQSFIKALQKKNIIPDSLQDPNALTTRGEMVEMLWRLRGE